jgi:hypothetical protein
MKLFHQDRAGDWTKVTEAVADELRRHQRRQPGAISEDEFLSGSGQT